MLFVVLLVQPVLVFLRFFVGVMNPYGTDRRMHEQQFY